MGVEVKDVSGAALKGGEAKGVGVGMGLFTAGVDTDGIEKGLDGVAPNGLKGAEVFIDNEFGLVAAALGELKNDAGAFSIPGEDPNANPSTTSSGGDDRRGDLIPCRGDSGALTSFRGEDIFLGLRTLNPPGDVGLKDGAGLAGGKSLVRLLTLTDRIDGDTIARGFL